MEKLHEFLNLKPSYMSIEDYKIEKAQERKKENEDFLFKKNVFLLNKQAIIKEYVRPFY